MKFVNPYWGAQTKIELLQKWILVHSIIYYEYNKNIVSDADYDANSRQLVGLMRIDCEASKASKWHYVFKGFTGSTGFDLYSKLKKEHAEDLKTIAYHLLRGRGGVD